MASRDQVARPDLRSRSNGVWTTPSSGDARSAHSCCRVSSNPGPGRDVSSYSHACCSNSTMRETAASDSSAVCHARIIAPDEIEQLGCAPPRLQSPLYCEAVLGRADGGIAADHALKVRLGLPMAQREVPILQVGRQRRRRACSLIDVEQLREERGRDERVVWALVGEVGGVDSLLHNEPGAARRGAVALGRQVQRQGAHECEAKHARAHAELR
eukprot:scaffold58950_cov63-Phaeocystis_antarctica.AAC.5